MKPRGLASWILVLGITASSASAQVIAVLDSSFDAGPNCGPETVCIDVPTGTPSKLYIAAANIDSSLAGGLAGAEFRLAGWPAAWPTSVHVSPAAHVVLGDPIRANDLGIVGTNIVYSQCMSSPFGWIILFTLDFTPTTAGTTTCHVEMHERPSNPNFQCPLVALCNTPVITAVCAHGLGTEIHSFPVAVQPSSWSRVKSLYEP